MHRQEKEHYRLAHQAHGSTTQASRRALHATTADVGSIIGEETPWRQEGAALGRVAMQAKLVTSGKANVSSPTRCCVDSPCIAGMRSSLVGTRASGEGEPYSQEANVTDAAMVRLNCRTRDTL